MKKSVFICSLFLLLIAIPGAHAQTFGVKAGIQFPSMLVKDDAETYSDNNKIKPAFHLGGVVDYAFTEAFSLEGGLLFSLKGGRVVEEDGGYTYTSNVNLWYFVIPVTAKYTYDLGNIKIYGLAGPNLGLGISGKYNTKYEFDGDEESDSEKVEWGGDEDNDDLIRPDLAFELGGGVVFGNIQAGLFYDLGVMNISPDRDDGFRIKNRAFGITAVYFFRK